MTHHLLTLWNPSYATDALETHLRLLLEWEARARTGDASPDDVHVWWGKVRSPQRQQPMPHLDDVLALDRQLADDENREVQLYLTDYRSLYVAELIELTAEDPRDDDAGHVPPYYTGRGLSCDCWFRLADIRLLVRDDLDGVAHELAQLRNARYHDRPVSLYGGMVELPLIVTRPDARTFFDARERAQYADGRLWARHDAEQGGVGAIEAVLRDDHFGAAAWGALEAPARRFVATAERLVRDHRRDPAADLSPVVVGYGKALEVQLNRLLREAVRGASDPARLVNVDGRTQRLPEALPLTLGQLARTVGGERTLGAWLRQVLDDGAWLTNECAVALDAFASEARNRAAHGETVPREVVLRWRDRLLGVGCEGLLVRLATVRRRS
jgi:hypothetical protein